MRHRFHFIRQCINTAFKRPDKRIADFDELQIPESVVFCKDDASLPPGAYPGLAQGLGDFSRIEVSGGHEALFTKPGVVARGLLHENTPGRCPDSRMACCSIPKASISQT